MGWLCVRGILHYSHFNAQVIVMIPVDYKWSINGEAVSVN